MNVADQISNMAALYPDKKSVVAIAGKSRQGYRYEHYTFEELEDRINRFAWALKRQGVGKGDKTLLFVRPCLDFSALTFALFKIGAVPVFIDPGMGRRSFLEAIKGCSPKVLIGIPKVFLLKTFFGKWFESVEREFVYSKKGFLGRKSIIELARTQDRKYPSEKMNEEDMAAILFTSGGTGRPKGVVYTHDIFINQTIALQKEFGLTADDVDIPGFPLFALFTLSMGMTSCIPDMDPSRPGTACPKALLQVIMDQKATFAAGSPAIWKNLGRLCEKGGHTLPSLKYLVMFGAPIPIQLHEQFQKALPNGDTYTPYGATESLPIANARGSVILNGLKEKMNSGGGVYVGKLFDSVSLKIIEPLEGALSSVEAAKTLEPLKVGEILVHSPTTTKSYYKLPCKTAESKATDEQGRVWHRMGDMGMLDGDGHLWFCGRKAHVVQHDGKSHYSVMVEAVFNQHPLVKRSALIEVDGAPALAIERMDGKKTLRKYETRSFYRELRELGSKHDHTKDFKTFFLTGAFPVDIRHNIKIDRKKLAGMVKKPLEAQ